MYYSDNNNIMIINNNILFSVKFNSSSSRTRVVHCHTLLTAEELLLYFNITQPDNHTGAYNII